MESFGRIIYCTNGEAHRGVGAVVAVLCADALHRLTGISQFDLVNRTLDGDEIFGRVARDWQDLLTEDQSAPDRVRRLEQIRTGLATPVDRRSLSFEYALDRIRRSGGRIRVEQLARELHWSRRRLDRAFNERVGVSPKRLASVLRFQAAYRHLKRAPGERPDDRSIYDYYFDQSHFLKEFKRFSGLTPRAYDGAADYGQFYIP